MKIFLAVAALVVIVALLGGRESLHSGADATVRLRLAGDTSVDAARERVIGDMNRTWQATRVSESSGTDEEATVEFALPGTNLDGAVGALRNFPEAETVDVSIDVEPEQLSKEPLAGAPAGEDAGQERAAPEPVRLAVTLTRSPDRGPWVTVGGAVLVAALALGALAWVQRRWGDPGDEPASPHGQQTWN